MVHPFDFVNARNKIITQSIPKIPSKTIIMYMIICAAKSTLSGSALKRGCGDWTITCTKQTGLRFLKRIFLTFKFPFLFNYLFFNIKWMLFILFIIFSSWYQMFRRVLLSGRNANIRCFSSTSAVFARALVFSDYGSPERVLEYVNLELWNQLWKWKSLF